MWFFCPAPNCRRRRQGRETISRAGSTDCSGQTARCKNTTYVPSSRRCKDNRCIMKAAWERAPEGMRCPFSFYCKAPSCTLCFRWEERKNLPLRDGSLEDVITAPTQYGRRRRSISDRRGWTIQLASNLRVCPPSSSTGRQMFFENATAPRTEATGAKAEPR